MFSRCATNVVLRYCTHRLGSCTSLSRSRPFVESVSAQRRNDERSLVRDRGEAKRKRAHQVHHTHTETNTKTPEITEIHIVPSTQTGQLSRLISPVRKPARTFLHLGSRGAPSKTPKCLTATKLLSRGAFCTRSLRVGIFLEHAIAEGVSTTRCPMVDGVPLRHHSSFLCRSIHSIKLFSTLVRQVLGHVIEHTSTLQCADVVLQRSIMSLRAIHSGAFRRRRNDAWHDSI